MSIGQEVYIKQLEQEIASLKKQLQFVTEDLEDWKERYKELEKELKEAKEDIQFLQAELRNRGY